MDNDHIPARALRTSLVMDKDNIPAEGLFSQSRAHQEGGVSGVRTVSLPPPTPHPPRTMWTRRVPHPVLTGHAASLTHQRHSMYAGERAGASAPGRAGNWSGGTLVWFVVAGPGPAGSHAACGNGPSSR